MPDRPTQANCGFSQMVARLAAVAFLWLSISPAIASEFRRTLVVKAVEAARPSVVNIFGEKRLGPAGDLVGQYSHDRRVNGMGTGVVIDERGYVLTNYHVVEGVEKIQARLTEQETYEAKLIGFDRASDLAIVRLEIEEPLPVIKIGTSRDLMTGEEVIAVGNAYGYGHTVTRGIVSALKRAVQVNEFQSYDNLIQTDASINPGNSGGPLLNIDGDMIGINVAVRAGAQGIGFAIPVDDAMKVASNLLSKQGSKQVWHGLSLSDKIDDAMLPVVTGLEQNSPAVECGLKLGDRIVAVDTAELVRSLDFQRALLDRQPGEKIELDVERDGRTITLNLVLSKAPQQPAAVEEQAWEVLGVRLQAINGAQFRRLNSRYRGGLSVVEVRDNSPASRQGIRSGDVLVGMHVWETLSLDNVAYILNRLDNTEIDPLKFYILRGGETLYGFMPLSPQTARR